MLLLTIGYGASAIAGQDEDGTLGLIVTLPLSRRRILVQKAMTLVAVAVPAGLATILVVLTGRGFGLSLGTGHLVGATTGAVLLGIDFGALALLVGALSGSRAIALGVTSSARSRRSRTGCARCVSGHSSTGRSVMLSCAPV